MVIMPRELYYTIFIYNFFLANLQKTGSPSDNEKHNNKKCMGMALAKTAALVPARAHSCKLKITVFFPKFDHET